MIETDNFYHGVAKCSRQVAENFAWSFSLQFLSIFVHISGSIEVSLQRSFPPAELEYR